ncbi:MAG TPA: hypothetical protein VFJ85_08940 [Acidimicrobiales bacterium]|nr:hypothetical protein [Acidimicrobiales bacterium]
MPLDSLVGVDPDAARRLALLLDDAATSLTGCAGRVQRLLDEAGVSCLAPVDLRDVAGWCGTAAADVRRRSRDVQLMERWSTVLVPQPKRGGAVGCNLFVVLGATLSCRIDGRVVQGGAGGWTDTGAGGGLGPQLFGSHLPSAPADAEGSDPPAPPRLIYEPSPKHDQVRGGVGPQPTNPEKVLGESVEVNPRRRVGYDKESGEIVVFHETHPGKGIYHGYVAEYSALRQPDKNALKRAGLVDERGRPMK